MQTTRRRLTVMTVVAGVAIALLLLGVFAFVRAGIYNVGADDPHYPMTTSLLAQVRDASIEARARRLEAPQDLMSEERIIQGAGNYAAMCTQCHLAPGMGPTELSKGLYPAPPDLTKQTVNAAEAFWVIKHGVKASGMPAWGSSMGDEYIWNMAAFIQRLPKLDAAQYQALVAKSDGHSHGGGETTPHDHGTMPAAGGDHPHPPGTPADHHGPESAPAVGGHPHPPGRPAHHDKPAAPAPGGHAHAPGTPPHVDAPAKAPATHDHAPGTPAHVDPPGTPPHDHAPAKPGAETHSHAP